MKRFGLKMGASRAKNFDNVDNSEKVCYFNGLVRERRTVVLTIETGYRHGKWFANQKPFLRDDDAVEVERWLSQAVRPCVGFPSSFVMITRALLVGSFSLRCTDE
jgi:hypothetical protein